MSPIVITLIGLLEKYGPQAYQLAVNLIHKKDPSIADYNALYDAAASGSYTQDLIDARNRSDAAALTVK